LTLAISCLASVNVHHDTAQARNLFLASRYLLGVIMEIDNRESRSADLLMAVRNIQLVSLVIIILTNASCDPGNFQRHLWGFELGYSHLGYSRSTALHSSDGKWILSI
jgi:hypothetical protein